MNQVWRVSGAILISAVIMSGAQAAPAVTLTNPSFEKDKIKGQDAPLLEVRDLPPTGWQYYGDGPMFLGLIAPATQGNRFYTSAIGLDGSQAFYMKGGPGTGGIRQVLSTKLAPNTTYDLSMLTGTRTDGSPFGGYRVELRTVSGAPILSWDGAGRNPAAPGHFAPTSRRITTGTHPLGVNEAIEISISRPPGNKGGYLDLDEVKLTATPAAAQTLGQAIDVYLVSGQSNAHGWGVDVAQLSAENRHYALSPAKNAFLGYQQKNLPDPLYSIGSVAQLSSQGAGFSGNCDGFGPELSLGTDLAVARKAPVALLKFTVGSAGLAANIRKTSPQDPDPANHLYAPMIAFFQAALKQLTDQGYKPQIKALFWLQGESDTGPETAPAYRENITQFIADLRADLSAPDMKVFLTEINANTPALAPNAPLVAVLNDGMVATAGSQQNVYFVPINDITSGFADGIHYSANQTIDIGQRWAKAYLEASK